MCYNRFVLTSPEEIQTRQTKQSADISAELANLEKKLAYLETTYKNSQMHLDQLFQRAG